MTLQLTEIEIDAWPSQPKEFLFARLGDIVSELVQLYKEQATTYAEERRAKSSAWFGVDARSIAERDRTADRAALAHQNVLSEIRGRIQGLETAKEFLTLLVNRG